MPKRKGYLYDRIWSWENLLLSFYNARKGKRSKQEVAEFEFDLEKELLSIQHDLKNESYQFSGYRQFYIFEPKKRLICCAPFRDRVVHHAIYNIISPVLNKVMIPDNYACRTGKGLHRAIKRAFYFYKNSVYAYKFDIRKYFYTIDHQILLDLLRKKIKDFRVIELITRLLATYHTTSDYYLPFADDDIFAYGRGRGLPIGNLTSQLFANFYLSYFDHQLKEDDHCMFYLRYMDDILIFSSNLDKLVGIKERTSLILKNLRLHIHPDKNQISKTAHGVNFLGFRFKNNQIRIQNRNLIRMKRNLERKAMNIVDKEKLFLSINGHLGFLKAGHTRKITRKIFNEIIFNDGKKDFKIAV